MILYQTPMAGRIRRLLIQLGATPNYIGYRYLVEAICLSLVDPQNLELITKKIYLEVATTYQTTGSAVERNIRTVLEIIWREQTPMLKQIIGNGIRNRPCISQFIGYICSWIEDGNITVVPMQRPEDEIDEEADFREMVVNAKRAWYEYTRTHANPDSKF